ncbi:PDR/VanB family oxidoreductase [Saccharomonospora sp. NPDC006951]
MTAGIAAEPRRAHSQHEQRQVRVTAMTWQAEGVLSLVLADPDGGELEPWEPGAHIDLLLGNGLERQYSLCGDPADTAGWTVAVLAEPASRGGSAWIHRTLRPGDVLTVRGPRNNFPLAEAAQYLFIAGGIGITPILPMVYAVGGTGAPWRLLYGGRRRDSMAFLSTIERFGDNAFVRPEDETGLLDLASALDWVEPGGVVHCCGPEPLITAVEAACEERAIPLRVERFAAKARDSSGESGAFQVTCRRSGVTIEVGRDQSIVDAVEAAGLGPRYSCLDGVCGTCETAVFEGEPEHRDSILSQDERDAGDTMMICVSRSRSDRLVLDL